MKKSSTLLLLLISISIFSCRKDFDLPSLDRKFKASVEATETLLQDKPWNFNDFIITVKNEMRAIPLMANVADESGMVQPGEYTSIEIFGNQRRQFFYHYKFTNHKILRDTLGYGAYHPFAYYNVLSNSKIRVHPDSVGIATYDYSYNEMEGIFYMTSDHLTNDKINQMANKMINTAIRSGKVDDISNAVLEKILGNEEIQMAIQEALYDLIHQKLTDIAEDPETISNVLANAVLEKLKEVDWESLVYSKVVEILEELKVDNPEQAAQELAERIAQRIETSISQDDIYNKILPVLIAFEDETLPELVPVLAETIYDLFINTFSGEMIYDQIYPIWTEFTQVDSTTIIAISDTLGAVFTGHFFDADDLALSLEPFIETLRNTNTLQIPALAQDIIDEVLIPLVADLNATFPGLALDPDWNQVKTVLSSALTAIKASIGNQTNAEAAANLANSIIGIMDNIISNGVSSALFYLQDIPAEQASQVIAAWVYNLALVAEPQITEFLENKLNELADQYNAEEVAEELSNIIYGKILEVFSADQIYDIILPIMEELGNIDVESAAQVITDWLFELDLIEDNITEAQVLAILSEIIGQLIGNMDVDEASTKLLELIINSDIVQSIDGAVLQKLLELKTYEMLIDLKKEINAIEHIEYSIIKKS